MKREYVHGDHRLAGRQPRTVRDWFCSKTGCRWHVTAPTPQDPLDALCPDHSLPYTVASCEVRRP